MARTRQTARRSTRGPPHPIHHSQKVPDQVEPEQLEDLPEFVIVEDDDDDYYGYHEDAAGEDGADSGAAGGDNAKDGDDDPTAPDGGDKDPDDDPEPAVAVDPPPPEPHYEKQIHCLDFAEGPFPALLWRAMQRIGFH
jgi:hypothetical protein